jgi:hypothetical protein
VSTDTGVMMGAPLSLVPELEAMMTLFVLAAAALLLCCSMMRMVWCCLWMAD